MENVIKVYGKGITMTEVLNDVKELTDKGHKIECFSTIGNNEGFQIEYAEKHNDVLFSICEEDIDNVVEDMCNFYCETERMDKYNILKAIDKEHIYNTVKYKLEMPWYEDIEGLISAKFIYR